MDKNADNPDNDNVDKMLTIPEAASTLGIHERRLRRLLSLPEYAVRTVTQARKTQTGTRQSVMVPTALMDDLRIHFEVENSVEQVKENTVNNGDDNSVVTPLHERFHQAVEAFEANKELFDQLRSENAYLRSELTAEREARTRGDREFRELLLRRDAEVARLQERVQLLLAAPHVAEEPVQDLPQETSPMPTGDTESASVAIGEHQDGDRKSVGSPEPTDKGQKAQETAKRVWWQFWRKD